VAQAKRIKPPRALHTPHGPTRTPDAQSR
jgi:hypothetical protein